MEVNKQQKHFVLVHGACHGAWCWYKLKPRIESAGHRVTTLDLAASGINTKKLDEVHTFYDYTVPLLDFMASIPPNEKVILVGHSLGGMSIALAMDNFPEKISVAVFVCAFMPDTLKNNQYPLSDDPQQTKAQTPRIKEYDCENQRSTSHHPVDYFQSPTLVYSSLSHCRDCPLCKLYKFVILLSNCSFL